MSAHLKLIQKFKRDASGVTAMMFALSVMVLVGFIGLTADFALGFRAKSALTSYADAAALAAAGAARDYILSQNGYSAAQASEAKQIAEEAARKYFADNATGNLSGTVPSSIKVEFEGRSVVAEVTFSKDLKTVFGPLFGVSELNLEGTSQALASMPGFIDLHLLIDTSGSMALGVGSSEQAMLKANLGCAFACHDGVSVRGYADAYAYATSNNITLRYDAVNSGITELMDLIDEQPGHKNFVRTAVYSFDNTLHTDSNLTSNTSVIRRKLPTAPATSGEHEGATHFNEIIGEVIRKIGVGGDGSSASKRTQLLIIATDGVQDPGRFWVSDTSQRKYVAPFKTDFCQTLKDNNVVLGIIHTPYLPMTYDWGYQATLGQPSQIGGPGTRADDVPIVLKKCAGNLYVEASDEKSIKTAFARIFDTLTNLRLTK